MNVLRAGLLIGAVLLCLPATAEAANSKYRVMSDDGFGLVAGGRTVPGLRTSPGYRGSGRSLSEQVVEDALASVKGGRMSDEDLVLLRTLKPKSAPVGIESVIGKDTRKRIRKTKQYPYSAVAMIVFENGFLCTGWMINRNTLATAGHCVHEGGGGDYYTKSTYKIFPGANGGATPFGQCKAKRLYTVTGWGIDGDDRYDFGAIKLNCNIGNTVGWFGYFWIPGTLNGLPTNIVGYPGDKAYGTMWKSTGKVTKTQGQRVFYKNDTYGGMSGSPVYYNRPGCGQCGMAIHAYGVYNGPPFSNNNHGTRVTKGVFNNFEKWKNAN